MDFWNEAGFWDGGGGAIIGSLLSVVVAFAVLFGTQRHDKHMAQHSRSLDVATAMYEPLEGWRNRLRDATSAISVGREAVRATEELPSAFLDKTLGTLRAAEEACETGYSTIRARAMQIDDQRVQRALQVKSMRLPLASAGIWQARMSDPFEPYTDGLLHDLGRATEALDAIDQTLLDYLRVAPPGSRWKRLRLRLLRR